MPIHRRKPGRKSTLPVSEIKHMLDEGMRQKDVALIFNVSQTTISRLAATPDLVEDTRLCSCCQERPVAKGNRLLCSHCFTHKDLEEHVVWA
jgi:hypothetical protein